MVERQLPKLHTRVRFPSPAPILIRGSHDDRKDRFRRPGAANSFVTGDHTALGGNSHLAQSLTVIFHDLILVIRDLVFVICHLVLVLFLTFRVRRL
jgi:hypothetical protein